MALLETIYGYNGDMAITWLECWRCELCGHRWIRVPDSDPPRLCAKCKRTKWHTKTADNQEQQSVVPATPARTIEPESQQDIISRLRAQTDAIMHRDSPRLTDYVDIPEPEPVKMCSHREWDSELGEWYGCSLPEHSRKTKCQRGQQVDGPSSR